MLLLPTSGMEMLLLMQMAMDIQDLEPVRVQLMIVMIMIQVYTPVLQKYLMMILIRIATVKMKFHLYADALLGKTLKIFMITHGTGDGITSSMQTVSGTRVTRLQVVVCDYMRNGMEHYIIPAQVLLRIPTVRTISVTVGSIKAQANSKKTVIGLFRTKNTFHASC